MGRTCISCGIKITDETGSYMALGPGGWYCRNCYCRAFDINEKEHITKLERKRDKILRELDAYYQSSASKAIRGE